jgi:hypothetical protein
LTGEITATFRSSDSLIRIDRKSVIKGLKIETNYYRLRSFVV